MKRENLEQLLCLTKGADTLLSLIAKVFENIQRPLLMNPERRVER